MWVFHVFMMKQSSHGVCACVGTIDDRVMMLDKCS